MEVFVECEKSSQEVERMYEKYVVRVWEEEGYKVL